MELTLYRGAEEIITEVILNEETGEIGTDFPLEVLVKRNPVGCAAYVLHNELQASVIKSRIAELQKMAKAAESRAERVKQSLADVMALTGVSSIESPDYTFKVKLYKERDKSVDVFDEKQLPANYLREIPASYAPDKKRLLKDIENGNEIPGARIVKADRLEIK